MKERCIDRWRMGKTQIVHAMLGVWRALLEF